MMFRFLEALPRTTLLYQSSPEATRAELATLQLTGAALLAACRYPLGFPLSTNFFLVLLGQVTLMIGGLVFLLRGGKDAVKDSMKLSRLVLVTWTLTLILFIHNFFEPTRVLYWLPGLVRALVYAGLATLVIAVHTINQERGRSESTQKMPWMAIAASWVLLTAVVAVCLHLFVISETFSEQIQEFLPPQDESPI